MHVRAHGLALDQLVRQPSPPHIWSAGNSTNKTFQKVTSLALARRGERRRS
jgi:hypothetical protein